MKSTFSVALLASVSLAVPLLNYADVSEFLNFAGQYDKHYYTYADFATRIGNYLENKSIV